MLLFRLYIVLYIFLASSRLVADDLPYVTQHSRQDVLVEQADVLELQVEVESSNTKILWYSAKGQVCAGRVCRLDTKGWTVGEQFVYAIALNKVGSVEIEFRIRVVKNNSPKKLVIPPLVVVASQLVDPGKPNDYILALNGRGFAYLPSKTKKRRLEIISSKPRSLVWNQNIRSSKALVKFGQLDVIEVYMLADTHVQLATVGGIKYLNLESGRIRVRGLSRKDKYVVRIEGLGDIRVEANSDFIVELKSKQAREFSLQVNRGRAEVEFVDAWTLPDPYSELRSDELEQEQLKKESSKLSQMVEARSAYRFFPGGGKLAVSSEKISQDLWNWLGLSSPSWLGRAQTDSTDVYRRPAEIHTRLSGEDPLFDLQSAAAMKPKDDKYKFRLARVFSELGWLEAAAKLLEDISSEDTSFELARLYLSMGRYSKAKLELRKAQRNDSFPQDEVSFHLAECYEKEFSYKKAEYEYEKSTVSHQMQTSRAALRLWQLKRQARYSILFKLGLSYDSHIFGVGDQQRLELEDEKWKSQAISAFAQGKLNYRFLKSELFDGRIFFDFNQNTTLSPETPELESFKQSFGISLDRGFEDWKLGLDIGLDSYLLAKQRAYDGVFQRLRTDYISPVFGEISLVFFTGRLIDPLPDNNDAIDLLSGRLQAIASDRSSSLTEAKLSWQRRIAKRFSMRAGYAYRNRALLAKLARSLNENRSSLSIEAGWNPNLSSELSVILAKHSSKFEKQIPVRSDDRSLVALSYWLSFSRSLIWETSLEYGLQTSSESLYEFNRTRFESGLKYRY